MQSNARLEKTIIELQASLSAVGNDLEELKKSGMQSPPLHAPGLYRARFGDGSGREDSAEGGMLVYMGPAGAKVSELEAQQVMSLLPYPLWTLKPMNFSI